jgi:hypothetical protein
MAETWHLKGKVLVACNCDWGCPCNFNARPTAGKCEGGWTWHVEQGSYSDVKLNDLNFSVYVNWPGAIHEGNGEALILIDEHADQAQRTAIEMLVGGNSGGRGEFWAGRGQRYTVPTPRRTTSPSMESTRASNAVSTSRLNAARSEIQ